MWPATRVPETCPKEDELFSFMENPSQSSQPDHADLAQAMCQELMDYFKTTPLEYYSDLLAW